MPDLVIGLTGSFGSGCSTITQLLQERFNFSRSSMSSPIRDQWANENPTRNEILPRGRRCNGSATTAGGTAPLSMGGAASYRVDNQERYVVIDSIRNLAEVEYFRDRFSNFYLVAVQCSKDERWSRVRSDYMQQGLHQEQFDLGDASDQIEEEEHGQQVIRCVDAADLIINNESHHPNNAATLAALSDTMEMYVGLLSGKEPIAPTVDEVAMTIAYAQSRRSFCTKRHVGAVITDEQGEVVATGFNENPSTMSPCYIEFQYCYKDSMMTKALLGTRCPDCQRELPELHEPFVCQCGADLKLRYFPDRGMRWCTALHAEERALLNLNGVKVTNGALYTTTFPVSIALDRLRRQESRESSTWILIRSWRYRHFFRSTASRPNLFKE